MLVTVDYVPEDFTHVDSPHYNCERQQLRPDMLVTKSHLRHSKGDLYEITGQRSEEKPAVDFAVACHLGYSHRTMEASARRSDKFIRFRLRKLKQRG